MKHSASSACKSVSSLRQSPYWYGAEALHVHLPSFITQTIKKMYTQGQDLIRLVSSTASSGHSFLLRVCGGEEYDF